MSSYYITAKPETMEQFSARMVALGTVPNNFGSEIGFINEDRVISVCRAREITLRNGNVHVEFEAVGDDDSRAKLEAYYESTDGYWAVMDCAEGGDTDIVTISL